jgi:hypothetical protein
MLCLVPEDDIKALRIELERSKAKRIDRTADQIIQGDHQEARNQASYSTGRWRGVSAPTGARRAGEKVLWGW